MPAAAIVWTILLAPIDWRAPAQCPDAAEVERRALALGPDVAALHVAGDVSHADDGTFVLQLAIGDAPARRYVARNCSALADIAALVLAVARDPIAVAAKVEETISSPSAVPSPGPAIAAPVASAPAIAEPLPRTAGSRPRARPPIEAFARAHGLVGIGELPRFDAGVGVAFGIGAGSGRFELHAAHLFARTAVLPGPGDVSLRSRRGTSPRVGAQCSVNDPCA